MLAGQVGLVSTAGALALLPTSPAFDLAFTLENVPQGQLDVMAARLAMAEEGMITDRLILRRSVDPAGNVLQPLDFNGDEAFEAALAPITVQNLMGYEAVVLADYWTPAGGALRMGIASSSSGGPNTYPGVPPARQEENELHVLTAVALDDDDMLGRIATISFREVDNKTLELGPPLIAPDFAATGGSLSARFRVQPEYDRVWLAGFNQEGVYAAAVLMFAGYLDESVPAGLELSVPDLSSAAGWSPQWQPSPSAAMDAIALAMGGESGLGGGDVGVGGGGWALLPGTGDLGTRIQIGRRPPPFTRSGIFVTSLAP